MDANNQIDATISPDALARFNRELSNLQPKEDGPKKHRVQLSDFSLVITYSTPAPDVRLHINHFHIDWNKGPLKFKPAKKLRKDKTVKSQLEKVHQKAQSAQESVESNGAGVPLGQSSGSDIGHFQQPDQPQSSPSYDGKSQGLFSQVPIHDNHTSGPISNSGRSLHTPAELLQRLMPSFRSNSKNYSEQTLQRQGDMTISANGSPPNVPVNADRVANPSRQPTPLAPLINGSFRESTSSSQTKVANNELSNSAEIGASQSSNASSLNSQNATVSHLLPCENTDTDRPEAVEDVVAHGSNMLVGNDLPREHTGLQAPRDGVDRIPSRKRQHESVDAPSQLVGDKGITESERDSSTKKRQRTDATREQWPSPAEPGDLLHETTETSQLATQNLNANPGPIQHPQLARVDPWQGLLSIPASEVNISKDQAELLDTKICWIPPVLGETMPLGHVPPLLLEQWNSIAQRRHQLAKEAKAVSEQPPSPTQDTVMSSISEDSEFDERSYSWSGSPVQTRFETRLPADSSPVRQPSFTREKPTPDDRGHQPGLEPNKDDSEEANGSHNASHTEKYNTGVILNAPQASAPKGSPPVEERNANAGEARPLTQVSLNEPEQRGTDVDKHGPSEAPESQGTDQPQSLSKQRPSTRSKSPESGIESYNDNSGNESDESVMDTSVPLGLGENWVDPTQSTQAEEEMTSSGPSLPAEKEEHVQVAVTPVVDTDRLHHSKPHQEQAELEPSKRQLPSSQANKTSSQSRILSTYPHHGRYENSKSSHEGADSSSTCSEPVSLRVDVAGTQTQNSSSNELSQNATQSQDIVLDSSAPAQRHQDLFLLGPQSALEPSILQFASPHDPAPSQPSEPTQNSMKGNLSLDGSMSSPQVSPTRRWNAGVVDQDQSPSRSPRDLPHECESASEALLNTQSAALVARRLSHIGNPEKVAQAKEVYKRFCDDYTVYDGGFAHFAEMCSKLQAVRAQGQLQRSFLWDDFIIMHLKHYHCHIEERASQESESLSYEDYFSLNFTNPVYRKRSLAMHGIALAASQFIPSEKATLFASSQVHPDQSLAQVKATSPSFTTSLVDKLSNLHAHSFNEVVESSLPDADACPTPDAMRSRASSVAVMPGETEVDSNEVTNIPTCSMDKYEEKVKPVLSSFKSCIVQNSQMDIGNANHQDDADDVSMGEVEESDLEDTRHETASIELGDDTFISPAAPSRTRVTEPEPESEDENWFVSLRRMHPTGPVWSDDPHTPFKRWAEADQNLLSERLRRGGAKILLDEKGVIRRAIHR